MLTFLSLIAQNHQIFSEDSSGATQNSKLVNTPWVLLIPGNQKILFRYLSIKNHTLKFYCTIPSNNQ